MSPKKAVGVPVQKANSYLPEARNAYVLMDHLEMGSKPTD